MPAPPPPNLPVDSQLDSAAPSGGTFEPPRDQGLSGDTPSVTDAAQGGSGLDAQGQTLPQPSLGAMGARPMQPPLAEPLQAVSRAEKQESPRAVGQAVPGPTLTQPVAQQVVNNQGGAATIPPFEPRAGEKTVKVMPAEFRGQRGTRALKSTPPPVPPQARGGALAAGPSVKRGSASKIIAIFFIVLLLAGAGVFIYYRYFYESPAAEVPLTPSLEFSKDLPVFDTKPTEATDTVPTNETVPDTTPASTTDSDGDGLTDTEEEILGTNLQDADSDRDGIPDGWEHDHGLGPLDPSDNDQDPDSDALDNINEYYYGSDPFQADTDNDGYADGVEIENGYDPLNGDGALLEERKEAGEGGDPDGGSALGVATAPPGRDRLRKADMKALELALELYYDDHGVFPEDLAKLVPDYVVRLPEDPKQPAATYQYLLLSPASYELSCGLEVGDDPDDLIDGAQDQVYRIKVSQ